MRNKRKYIVFVVAMTAMSAVWIGTASASGSYGNSQGCDAKSQSSYGSGHNNCKPKPPNECEKPHKGDSYSSKSYDDSSHRKDNCDKPEPVRPDTDCDGDDVCVTPPVVTPPPPPVVVTVPGPTVTVTVPGPTQIVTVPGPTVTVTKTVKKIVKIVVTRCPSGTKPLRWMVVKKRTKRVVGNTTIIKVTIFRSCVPRLKHRIIPTPTG